MKNKRIHEVYVVRRLDKEDPIEPGNWQPMYFGKGREDNGRKYEHRREAKNCQNDHSLPRSIKIKIIIKLWEQDLDIKEETYIGGLTEEEAFQYEMNAIVAYGRINNGTGCLANLTDGGEGASGYRHSDESRIKISETHKGENHWAYGEPMPEEVKDKISKSLTGLLVGEKSPQFGVPRSEETKQKIRENQPDISGENHPLWGVPMPEERKAKISRSLTGRKATEETRKKQSVARKGKPSPNKGKCGLFHHTEEYKKEQSEKHKGAGNPFHGKQHSEESLLKMSESHKGCSPSEEARRKMSEAQSGENHPMHGKFHSEITKKQMRESQRRHFATKSYVKDIIERTKQIELEYQSFSPTLKNKENDHV